MKRRAVMLVLALFLGGAIVNVAVAWGCVILLPPLATQNVLTDNYREMTDDESTTLLQQRFNDASLTGAEAYGHSCWRFGWRSFETSWSAEPGSGVSVDVHMTDAGWPATSMQGGYQWDARIPNAKVGYFAALEPPQWMQSKLIPCIPVGPLWPGFAINTVFYAAILWMLFAAPFALRRRLRRKRGLCPACGYDLRGTASAACPECGSARKRQSER